VTPQELLATMYRSLGIAPGQMATEISRQPPALFDDADAIDELFT
jgi:hypothetical protein